MFSSIGMPELLVILLIALLLFGNRLPVVGKALGEGIRNFKKGLGGQAKDETEEPTTSTDKSVQRRVAATIEPSQLHRGDKAKADVVDVEHRDVKTQ